MNQDCSLGLDVSASRWSQDVFLEPSAFLLEIRSRHSVFCLRRKGNRMSRSHLGVGPQRLILQAHIQLQKFTKVNEVSIIG